MRKIFVEELSQKSKDLFTHLAKQFSKENNVNLDELLDGLESRISELQYDSENALGFRICENPECRELFNDGYMMEDNCENYCSRECAEKIYPEIVEEDYGTDTIFWTEWQSE